MNLRVVKELVESLTVDELEAHIHQIQERYFEASPELQVQLLDCAGDYLKALDVRLQMDEGVDETTALRDLARRMRILSANQPYSQWLEQPKLVAGQPM